MRSAAEMAAEGQNYTQIAKALGVSRETVGRWFSREDMQTLRQTEMANVLNAMAPRAYKVLDNQLNSKNPWVAQGAAREVIRLWQQMQGAADASVLVTFAAMPLPGAPKTSDAIETAFNE